MVSWRPGKHCEYIDIDTSSGCGSADVDRSTTWTADRPHVRTRHPYMLDLAVNAAQVSAICRLWKQRLETYQEALFATRCTAPRNDAVNKACCRFCTGPLPDLILKQASGESPGAETRGAPSTRNMAEVVTAGRSRVVCACLQVDREERTTVYDD